MEEGKFEAVSNEEKEPKGFKVRVVTILIILAIIIFAIIAINRILLYKNNEAAKSKVEEVLAEIKEGNEDTLEKYLNYNDLLVDSETVNEEMTAEDLTEDVQDENDLETEESQDLDATSEAFEKTTEMFKRFLETLDYKVDSIDGDFNKATVEVSISNKDSGEIFKNYFTRAIKLAISQALSSSMYDGNKMTQELEEYFNEQVNSVETPKITNKVNFYLEKVDGKWEIMSEDKNLIDVVFPNLINTIEELSESYGEYGD